MNHNTNQEKNQSTIGLAKKNYSAIGIGEAYPATIMQIARWARTLKGKMIDLAPVSAVVRDNFQKPTQSVSGSPSCSTSIV